MKKDAGVSPRKGRPYVSLRGRDEFTRVYRSDRRIESGEVVVLIAPGLPGAPQVGVVAGRRVGNAVRRNRAKRLMREALASVALSDNTAYIVIARPGLAGAGFGDVVAWLDAAVSTNRKEIEE